MITKTIDILTIAVMIIVLIVFAFEFIPIHRTVVSIFSANIYGF